MPEYRKKLIEVALPLEAINKESAREKFMRHGHPWSLHMWWARRPLSACRAVLFASLVDDPSSLPDEFPTEEIQDVERRRLFEIIMDLVKLENMTDEAVLHAARVEIARSAVRNYGGSLPKNMTSAEVANAFKRYAPPVLDPFCGGASIPLEAQRLGLEAHGSDLNPVAVLITKALVEIPSSFAGRAPINPRAKSSLLNQEWKRSQGLAQDVAYYGDWMRNEAQKRIRHLYPAGPNGEKVMAWLWARTIQCPNPACGAQMPLIRSFALSTKRGEGAYVVPIVDRTVIPPAISFTVQTGRDGPITGTITRQGAKCLVCGAAVSLEYIRTQGKSDRMGKQLFAVVLERNGGRAFVAATKEHEVAANKAKPTWEPTAQLAYNPRHMSPPLYGMSSFAHLFTPRQLVCLSTFSDLVAEVRELVLTHSGGDTSYANAVATYLAFLVDQLANHQSTLCRWEAGNAQMHSVFARPAMPMTWDFVESNPFSESSGSYQSLFDRMIKGFVALPSVPPGHIKQGDAMSASNGVTSPLISTDPPYYDNVPYADLSDFFYVWLRHSLYSIYPELLATLLTPKGEELVADPVRRGGREEAQRFFEEGLREAFAHMRKTQHHNYPLTVFYAFKQSELDSNDDDRDTSNSSSASTGWETMLEGLLSSGFVITGTWPMRTEMSSRTRGQNSNALATSVIFVCRPRATDAPLTTRRDFLNTLKRELPRALKDLQRGNVAPVDLAQAAIGPGMAVFSRYGKVLESDGTSMRVRTALQLINQTLDEVLAEQEGEYDADTRWAVAWFEQYGMEEGPYGVAETLSKAKNTAVGALVESGILRAQGGKVRLLRRNELSVGWNSATARRLTVWEVTQRLIRELQEQGDAGAAAILEHVEAYGEVARDLAYRLYTVCERKKWADEALAYNSLVVEWSDISGAVEQLRRTTAEQARLFS